MATQASSFLSARTFGAPAICLVSALSQWRQGVGDTRSPMAIGIAANLLNAPLAYALIHGHMGLPKLGVAGAGYGTATAEWLQALALLAILVRARIVSKRDAVATPKILDAARLVASLGVPTGLQFGFESLAFTTFTAILGGIGAHEIAAHQVAMAVVRMSFLPGIAIAEAGSVLVGRALGGRQLASADRSAKSAIVLAVGFMGVCGIMFASMRASIVGLFTSEADVVRVACRLLLVAALFQAMDAVTIVLRGVLRAAKDVRVVAVVGIACSWTFIPTAAWLLGKMAGLGAMGGWFGFLFETSLAAFIFSRRWRSGAWRLEYGPLRARPREKSDAELTPMPLAT
jgi:MATE family multidrug resistance protein